MSTNIEDRLNELESAHLIRSLVEPEQTFLFNHILVQETAYRSMLVKGRREYHRLIAAAIQREYAESPDDRCPMLAYHYWQAEDWPQAAEYGRRAGERALRVYGLQEALGFYRQALDALDRIPNPSGADICDTILGWAEAAFGFEPYPKQLEQLARAEKIARELGDQRRLALVLHTTGKVHIAAGYAFRASKALLECFTLATQLGDEKLTVIPTFYMGMATFDEDPRRAVTWFEQAVALARKYHEVDLEAYALSAKAMVEARLGQVDASQTDLAQASALVPEIKSPMCDSDVHLFSAFAWLDLENVERGLTYAKLGVEKAVSAANVQCACSAFACLGLAHLQAEQLADAAPAFQEAIRRSKISGAEEFEIMGQMGLGMIQFFSGEPSGIQELENALKHARKIGEQHLTAVLSQTLGEVYLAQGQVDQAIAALDVALAYYRRHQLRPYLTRALDLQANALERQGRADAANAVRAERAAIFSSANPPGTFSPREDLHSTQVSRQ